ncbi:MAG: glycosyltransferase family 9 protein [Acidobacteriia bacterium]|nr:glycosyltransferase family 9 protein [Terriglobia bacterium]
MRDSRRLLIIRLSSLGDIIHTLPAFQSLRSADPEARIDWLVERRLAFLLSAVEGIDEILPVDTRALRADPAHRESWRRLLEPIRAVRARHYDVAIDFQGLLKTAFLSLASGAKSRIGFSKALVRERPAHWFYHHAVEKPATPMHVARLNLLLAQKAGGAPGELHVRLRAPETDVRAIENHLFEEQLSDFVVINPGGGWPTKLWEPACYGALAARIQGELRTRVVVTTGPGEESLYQLIADHCTEPVPVHFHVPFLQLIPLFRRARLLVAGDTGPLHLACALETPVVGILGPTSPVRNGPWSGNDEVVAHHLPCSFCNGRSCPTQNECMDISVEEVFAAVVRRLERAK